VTAELAAEVAEAPRAPGCLEVPLGDIIRAGTPDGTNAMIESVARTVPVNRLARHSCDADGRRANYPGGNGMNDVLDFERMNDACRLIYEMPRRGPRSTEFHAIVSIRRHA
jgi:hypothetical protein